MARQEHGTPLQRRFRALLSPKRCWLLARETGFVQRSGGKINPFMFVWTLVLGFGHGKERTISALRRCYMRVAGKTLVPSSFYERFDGSLVQLLRRLLAHLVRVTVVQTMRLTGIFGGFSDVMITDASVLRLRDLLEKHFPACRTNHTKAAAKLHFVMSVTGLSGHSVSITGERRNDRREFKIGPWVKDRLLLFDLGYFGYRLFDRIARNGGFFVSRMKANSNPKIVSTNRKWRGRSVAVVGKKLKDVLSSLTRKVLDVNIEVTFKRRKYRGVQSQATKILRLIAIKNDATGDYHVYVTNVPPEKLHALEVAQAYEARWVIELMFKSWKGEFRLDELPSRKKEVVEALIYASLITMFVSQHALAYLRNKAGEAANRVKFCRVAAVLHHFATDLLLLVTRPDHSGQASTVLRLIEYEVVDPHLNRPSLLDRTSITERKAA